MADGAYDIDDKKAPKMSTSEQDTLIKEARDRLQQAWDKDKRNRQEMAIDMKFLAGDQWPDAAKTERTADNRPMLTINRMPQFVRQVVNPIREADLSIKVAPADGSSDPKLADVYNGIIRQIQYQSSASAVYAKCAEDQCGYSIGWAEVCTEYVHDETFDQELRIKAIQNPLSVYDDPGAIEPDRCDSNWRFITSLMPRPDFKAKYPKASIRDVDKPSDGLEGIYWADDDHVRVAAYWVKEPYEKTIAMLQNGQTVDMEKIEEAEPFFRKMLEAQITRKREVDCYKVKQYVISGSEVLEGPFEWAGEYFPQVPFLGSEVPTENGIYRYGIIRMLRDPQVLYNYARTNAAETMGRSAKAPFLLTPNQIKGYAEQWNTANLKNRPYLLFNADKDNPGPPHRDAPPDIPSAFVEEANIASEEMKATVGIYDASLGNKSNEQSGVAIRSRQIQGDVATYHYGDNFQRGLEYLGRVLVDLIPKIYDNERVMRIMGDDDEEEFVPINKTIGINPATQQPIIMNDLSAARFDVRVRIARSADSKRMEAANGMLDFAKIDPQVMPLIGDLIVKNSDWPGADEIAKRLRNMVPPQALVDPSDPSTQPPGPPDPMQNPVVASEVERNKAQAELYHMQAFAAWAAAGAQPEAQQPMAPFEAEQAQADKDAKIGNALAAFHKARAASAQADQAQHGATQAQANASKAVADAHAAHIDNAATIDQLSKGWHPTQQKPVPKSFGSRVKPTNSGPQSVQ